MVDFRYPFVFFLYAFPLLSALYRRLLRREMARELESWGDSKIRDRLFARMDLNASRWKRRIRWLAMTLLIFGAAGPQIGSKLTEVRRKGVDILIALDTSSSMRAEDVKPSRLQKAKFEISNLISGLKGDRIGIIVFAGRSHLYLPLTVDYDAAKLFLDAIDTDMIQIQGTAVGEALNLGLSSFPEDDGKHRVMIVVTDGEDHEGRVLDMAQKLRKSGIVVHTVGVGTGVGSLIPVFDEWGTKVDYKKDRKGKLVTTSLNETMLRELANEGGGVFTRFDNRSSGMDKLLDVIDEMDKRTLKTHIYSQFEDRYELLAGCAFLLLVGDILISNRRKGDEVWRGRFV